MSNNHLEFEIKSKSKNITYFKVKSGQSLYIYDNRLYIPLEMLSKEWLKKNNSDKIGESEKYKKKKKKEEDENYKSYFKEPTGLVNINGICYMNAVLQCFYYCKPLTDYFLNVDKDKRNTFGPVSNGYYNFVHKLNKGDSYAATEFKQAMINVDNTFIGGGGKDSKDVAILILSELHEELKENEKTILSLNENVDEHNKLQVFQEQIKLEKINSNNTIISDIFNFLLICEQKCNNCNNNTYCSYKDTVFSIETDNIIIFELEKICNELGKTYFPDISLEECLIHYIMPETNDCPNCKQKKTMKITKKFCRLPKIFIFVLSRGINAKFKCNIRFTSQLNFSKYYDSIEETNKTHNFNYDLIGATFAYDWSEGNGHTVAFCKSNSNYPHYYVFNDSRVRNTDINEINGKVPYLLFYERK